MEYCSSIPVELYLKNMSSLQLPFYQLVHRIDNVDYAAFTALAALLINIILGPSDWTASVTVLATSTNFVDSAEEIHE
jgi:hypothetical protein